MRNTWTIKVKSSKKANNDPVLCPIKGQKPSVGIWTGSRNYFSSLSLSITKTLPPCAVLANQPTPYLSSYILPSDSQGWLRSNKLLNRTVSCKLVGDFVSLYPSVFRDPIQPHCMLGRDIIQHLLALLNQWRHCSGNLWSFQSRLAVGANTHTSVV